MRDKNRIHPIIVELEDIWNKVPDWRFGQLLSNFLGDVIHKYDVIDIFFPEDGRWLKWLKEYNSQLKDNQNGGNYERFE